MTVELLLMFRRTKSRRDSDSVAPPRSAHRLAPIQAAELMDRWSSGATTLLALPALQGDLRFIPPPVSRMRKKVGTCLVSLTRLSAVKPSLYAGFAVRLHNKYYSQHRALASR